MESGETAETVEGKTVEDSDSERHDSRQHYDSEDVHEPGYKADVQSKYTKSVGNSKKSDKKESKKSAKKEGDLEVVVNSLKIEESKGRNVKDGAVAAIYHVDEETGRIEVYLEEKRASYPAVEARNKLSFFGGEIEEGGSDLVALIREIKEEFGTKEAQNSIIQSLEGGEPYRTLVDYVNGQEVKTHVWKIKVKSAESWKTIKNAPLVDGAGPGHALTHDEVWSKSDNSFAWGYGPVLKEIISKEIKELAKKAYSHKSLYSANNYTFSIITINQNHLQAIEDTINRSLISMDTSMPNSTLNYQNKTQSIHKPLYTN